MVFEILCKQMHSESFVTAHKVKNNTVFKLYSS